MLYQNDSKIETKPILSISILLSAIAVLLGAFAAHGLKDSLVPKDIAIFQTGVRYMMWHSISTICYSTYAEISGLKELWPGWMFIVGIILFSGSLFVLSLTSISWIGIVTPLGGISFVIGWIGFLTCVLKR